MDTRQFIEEHLHDDVHVLALKYRNAKVDMALALRQIEARQLLRKKVPSWSDNPDLLFPAHLSIEQCSSEATATYKASLLNGVSFADLTGGLGVDCHFISRNFQHSDYVEMNPDLCELAKHNFELLHRQDASAETPINVFNESAEDYLNRCEPLDCLFVELQEQLLQKAKRVMVKLSPMLDLSQALRELHHVKKVHVVAVANECKELLLMMEPESEGEPLFTCVNLENSQPPVAFTQEEERSSGLALAQEVGRYIYEPNAAVMKGGCYRLLTQRYGIATLHRNSHLYTSERLVEGFPGRVFEVEDWAVFGKKASAMLQGVDKASIAARNFPMSVAELRKNLKIQDGDQVYLFATTLSDERKVLIKTHKL